MNTSIGKKIKKMRKEMNISQDVLANYLGVSFQAVSKWENGTSLPDLSMIPAIASFFSISTDELFDFNLYDVRQKIELLCDEACKYRQTNPKKAERILKEGLKKYPGNELIINNLLYTIYDVDRHEEIISLCKALVSITKKDEIKYDAYRILAETYKRSGDESMVRETLALIPEIYFTKLQLSAFLLDGEEAYYAAVDQKSQSICMAIEMILCLVDYYIEKRELEIANSQLAIAEKLICCLKQDMIKPDVPLYDYAILAEKIEKKRLEITQ